MLRSAKFVKSPLAMLLAGAAAFAYYKISKMSPQERKDLMNGIKDKASKLFEQLMPEKQTGTTNVAA